MTARAIILVAGMSSRIRGVTGGLPKAFLKVGEESLIQRSIRLIRAAGVDDITLVTGFMAEMFREAFPDCDFVYNPEFKSTNTSVSLQLALAARRPHGEEPGRVFVINGDVFFAEGIIEGMLASPSPSLAAVQKHPLSEEEIKVFVDQAGRITRIGKHLNQEMAHGEAFGMYMVGPRLSAYLKQELKLLGNPKIFYEEAMDRLFQAGHDMSVYDVGEALVQEVDFPQDYQALKDRVTDRVK